MSQSIKMIIGSTRQGRAGKPIADWLVAKAAEKGITIELLDLQELALPIFDAALPPMYKADESEAGVAWAANIAEASGIVFLTPEYNRSIPASLKNAIDFLNKEWIEKPVSIVSYGWVDGGAGASKHLVDIISYMKAKIVDPEVHIQFAQSTFNEQGAFADIDDTLSPHADDFLAVLAKLA